MQSDKPKIVPMLDFEYDLSLLKGKKFVAIVIDPNTDKGTYHFNGVNNQEIIWFCTQLIHEIMSGDV